MLYTLIESVLLAISLSTDVFVAFGVYGARGIRVPARSAAATACVCTGVFAVFAMLGCAVSPLLHTELVRAVGAVMLLLLGLVRLFDALVKAAIRRGTANKRLRWNALGLHFLLEIYADPEYADVDRGGTLSVAEAVPLSLALSLDGAAAGFASGAAHNVAVMTAVSAAFTVAAIAAGLRIGRYAAKKSTLDLSPVGGVILIALAVMRLTL